MANFLNNLNQQLSTLLIIKFQIDLNLQLTFVLNHQQMAQLILTLPILLLLITQSSTLKLTPPTPINQSQFFNKTKIKFNEKTGTFTNLQHKNALIYFFSESQQNSSASQRQQFQKARHTYIKALIQLTKTQNQQKHNKIQVEKVQIQDQQMLNINDQINKKDEKTKKYDIQFYLVKCQHKISSLCYTVGINQDNVHAKVLLFASKEQILELILTLSEHSILFFLNEIKQISNYGQNKIVFTDKLNQIATEFKLNNKSFKQIIYGLFDQYFTYEILFFIIVFIVAPFSFGFISTKMQQRQNKKRLQKYSKNNDNSQTKMSQKYKNK